MCTGVCPRASCRLNPHSRNNARLTAHQAGAMLPGYVLFADFNGRHDCYSEELQVYIGKDIRVGLGELIICK